MIKLFIGFVSTCTGFNVHWMYIPGIGRRLCGRHVRLVSKPIAVCQWKGPVWKRKTMTQIVGYDGSMAHHRGRQVATVGRESLRWQRNIPLRHITPSYSVLLTSLPRRLSSEILRSVPSHYPSSLLERTYFILTLVLHANVYFLSCPNTASLSSHPPRKKTTLSHPCHPSSTVS